MLATEVWAMVMLAGVGNGDAGSGGAGNGGTGNGDAGDVYECNKLIRSAAHRSRLDHGGSWFSSSYIASSRPGPAVKVGLSGSLRAAGSGAGNGGSGNAEAGTGDSGNGAAGNGNTGNRDAADQQELQL